MEEIETKIEEKSNAQSFWGLVRFGLIALIIVVPIRIFIAQPFVVSGSSMVPTFKNADYLIVDEIAYRLGKPKRDDIVIFKYPKDTKKFFIKRIIGLPNETVNMKNGVVTIINNEHKNGLELDEPYINDKSSNEIHFELEDNEYFVMGDNRNGSSDSRVWGPVPRNLMVGRAFLRLWPINNMSIFPGKYTQAE